MILFWLTGLACGGRLLAWRESFACNMRARSIMSDLALRRKGDPVKIDPGFAVEAGKDHAAQMDSPLAGHGFLEIRQSKTL